MKIPLHEKIISQAEEIRKLKADNKRLRQESALYLGKWVSAQDLAYSRLVESLVQEPEHD